MNLFSKCAASLALACALIAPLSASAATPEDFISVSVNGKVLYLDQNPVMRNGTTLVPMRAIFEALGANIKWDAATKTVTANTASEEQLLNDPNTPNTNVVLTINKDRAQVNGEDIKLLEAPRIISGNTMVPLRFVGEALGATVKWYGSDHMIRVAQQGYEGALPDPKEFEEKAKQIDEATLWNIGQNLKRIQAGAQGGIIKIFDAERTTPVYTRVQLDSFQQAPCTEIQRKDVCRALGIKEDEIEGLAIRLINNYESHRKNYQELVLLLGLLNGSESVKLSDETQNRVMAFLVSKMLKGYSKFSPNMQSILKRQCVTSLALMSKVSPEAIEAVVKLYETENNNYILAPMPLFFRQHATEIKALPNGSDLLLRIHRVQSMYSAQVADALK
ncbi:copper amine oxidase N-terminal domain-containing protein [bacterium]|nr:copper amine oxidase N-terminal domain-containing protein [bacterium]